MSETGQQVVFNNCMRADSYKFLAECYFFPDKRLRETLDNCKTAIGGVLTEVLSNAPKAQELQRHQIDFSRLFIGPFKLLAPPYGSVYLEDGKFMGNSALAAKELFSQEGLDVAIKDAPDHITLELEFMYFLALKEAEARENADSEEADRLGDLQASFLGMHLGKWVSEFTDKIKENAQTDFYKVLAGATKRFVLDDLESLSGDSNCEG